MEFSIENVAKEKIIRMLKMEQLLRYSDLVQDMYDLQLNQKGDPELIEKTIQEFVLIQNGYDTSTFSINNYQSIGSFYCNDKEVIQAVHYLRINMLQDCPIKENQSIIDVDLLDLNSQSINLFSIYNVNKPLVILSGSIT